MAEHDRRALGRRLTELQVHGVVDPAVPGNPGRRGGAGPLITAPSASTAPR